MFARLFAGATDGDDVGKHWLETRNARADGGGGGGNDARTVVLDTE